MYIYSYVDWKSERDREIDCDDELNECDRGRNGDREREWECVVCYAELSWAELLYIYTCTMYGMCVCLHVIAKK